MTQRIKSLFYTFVHTISADMFVLHTMSAVSIVPDLWWEQVSYVTTHRFEQLNFLSSFSSYADWPGQTFSCFPKWQNREVIKEFKIYNLTDSQYVVYSFRKGKIS